MRRLLHSDDLPPLYAKWANEFLGGPIPAETEATCGDCAMLAGEAGTTRPDGATPFFNPDTKCCTYLPVLPNFLVGRMLADDSPEFARGRVTLETRLASRIAVSPIGIGRSATYDLLYVTSASSWFGRARAMRCPHYIEEGGQCGIWRHRAAVCATWFCKHVRGAVGQRFWKAMHRLLSTVERDLSLWCALELGVASDATRHLLIDRQQTPAPGAGDLDGVLDDAIMKAFGKWSGRETEFFVACSRLVAALRWHDVEGICGPEVRALTVLTREAFSSLRSQAVPPRLRVGPFKVIEPGQRSSIVEGYDGSDRVELPSAVLDVLHHFDGSTTTTVLQTIRAETGLILERDLVRLLVDLEILVPSRDE